MNAMHAVSFSLFLRLATNNTAPCHRSWVNERIHIILMKIEKRQTQTLVELAEVLLTGGQRGLAGGMCMCVCICGVLPIS